MIKIALRRSRPARAAASEGADAERLWATSCEMVAGFDMAISPYKRVRPRRSAALRLILGGGSGREGWDAEADRQAVEGVHQADGDRQIGQLLFAERGAGLSIGLLRHTRVA